jgi:hypothetical protein
MLITFVKNNITLVAIALFLLVFSILMSLKPGFLFNNDGSIRNFGVGYKKKTVVPVWLVSILLGILAYYLVIYFITLPRFKDI